jgi:dolichol kinase
VNPTLLGTIYLILYFAIAASTALVCHYLFPIPKELFRKILHFILLGSFLVFIFAYPTWQSAALAAIIFEVLVYPILAFFEHYKDYSELTTERKHGELKASLLLVFTMFAIVVAICWGYFGDKYLALASLYAWGIGDAFAALIGKQFGKHKIKAPKLDGKKSYEGTGSMFLVSFVTVTIILLCRGGLDKIPCLIIALLVATVAALTELYSKNGNDTVICPLSAMVALLPLVYLFGGL